MAIALALASTCRCSRSAAAVVWRRPVRALYAFVVGLALHNAVMAALFPGGVDGAGSDARSRRWKELLLAVALARVAVGRRVLAAPPFRAGARSTSSRSASARVVVVYALVPQDVLDGDAGAEAILLGVAALPASRSRAYLLGRSLALCARTSSRGSPGRSLGTAAALAAIGLVEDVHGRRRAVARLGACPATSARSSASTTRARAGMPENFAFNTRRGPLPPADLDLPEPARVRVRCSPSRSCSPPPAALLAPAARPPRSPRSSRRGLLFTLSRSTLLALAGGLVVLAVALRRRWPLAAAGADARRRRRSSRSRSPRSRRRRTSSRRSWQYQRQLARGAGASRRARRSVDPTSRRSRSHLTNLRDGARTRGRATPRATGSGTPARSRSATGIELEGRRVELHRARRRAWASSGLAALRRLEPAAPPRAAAPGAPRRRRAAAGLAAAFAGARPRPADRRVRRSLAGVLPLGRGRRRHPAYAARADPRFRSPRARGRAGFRTGRGRAAPLTTPPRSGPRRRRDRRARRAPARSAARSSRGAGRRSPPAAASRRRSPTCWRRRGGGSRRRRGRRPARPAGP